MSIAQLPQQNGPTGEACGEATPYEAATESESLGDRMVRLARSLKELGVRDSHIKRILATYDMDRVDRQISWLPYRKARKRSSMVVAAIDNDYEQPASLTDELADQDRVPLSDPL